MQNGHFELTFGSQGRKGTATFRVDNGLLTGSTDRGTTLEGLVGFDVSRQLVRFEVSVFVPPQVATVVLAATMDEPRRLIVRGELPTCTPLSRGTVDIGGRAVEIEVRYVRPL